MSKQITMKTAIEQILSALGQLEAFKSSREFAIKIENSPFMPLSIERHGDHITVTHYFEQNGELVPDPDMEFLELKSGRHDWIPIAIQQSTGSYCRAGVNVDGTWKFNAKTMRELESFSRMWARNLIAQGFQNGVIQYAKAG